MFKEEKKYYRDAFLFTALMSLVMFLPFVILDGGYLVYCGDYNAQQIPFYKHCVEMVHNGTFGWDWQADLGVDFIGSFGMIGNIFFWFMCLFPSSLTPYLMMPMLCVKIGLFGLFSFMYIRRFVSKPQSALIGGILYAFSGYSLQNFIVQFQDWIVWFPLLLIALEEAVINKRRVVFALAMALNCITNHFFFIQECIFLILYFVMRCIFDPKFSINAKDFFCLAFESIVGVLIASVHFLPSIYADLDIPRVGNTLTDWNFMFYDVPQRYGLILESIFFPPELTAKSEMFPYAASKWSSVAIYLPLFSMAGVLAFFKNEKNHWVKRLLQLCLLFAFVPALNASFTMLNKTYYARWFFMPTLMCCLATAIVLDNLNNEEYDFKSGVVKTTVITAFIGGFAMLSPFKKEVMTNDGFKEITVPRFTMVKSLPLWVSVGLAALSIIVLFLLVKQRKKKPYKEFIERVTGLTVIFSLFLGYYFVACGRELGPSYGEYKKIASVKFDLDDSDFYRIDSYNISTGSIYNDYMLWDMNSMNSFISVIPGSSFETYKLAGISRNVTTLPEYDSYGIRALARVKYFICNEGAEIEDDIMSGVVIIDDDGSEEWTEEDNKDDKIEIYKYLKTQGKFDIYVTDYALPMGFAYDGYYLYRDVNEKEKVDNLMVRAAILTKEQAEKYSDILEKLDVETTDDVSLETFKEDASARIAEGVTEFTTGKNGFTAISNYDTEKLVCFSVAWSEGWSATVNGEPVEVDKINGGLCAIRVPEGIGEISFTYETPWLRYGIIFSLIGVVLLTAYALFFKLRRGKGNAEVQAS